MQNSIGDKLASSSHSSSSDSLTCQRKRCTKSQHFRTTSVPSIQMFFEESFKGLNVTHGQKSRVTRMAAWLWTKCGVAACYTDLSFHLFRPVLLLLLLLLCTSATWLEVNTSHKKTHCNNLEQRQMPEIHGNPGSFCNPFLASFGHPLSHIPDLSSPPNLGGWAIRIRVGSQCTRLCSCLR